MIIPIRAVVVMPIAGFRNVIVAIRKAIPTLVGAIVCIIVVPTRVIATVVTNVVAIVIPAIVIPTVIAVIVPIVVPVIAAVPIGGVIPHVVASIRGVISRVVASIRVVDTIVPPIVVVVVLGQQQRCHRRDSNYNGCVAIAFSICACRHRSDEPAKSHDSGERQG